MGTSRSITNVAWKRPAEIIGKFSRPKMHASGRVWRCGAGSCKDETVETDISPLGLRFACARDNAGGLCRRDGLRPNADTGAGAPARSGATTVDSTARGTGGTHRALPRCAGRADLGGGDLP